MAAGENGGDVVGAVRRESVAAVAKGCGGFLLLVL
jgi:hypothetical protein